MSNFAPKRTSYDTGDSRWLRDALRAEQHDVTLNGDLFPLADFPGGVVPSGTVIGKVTATKLSGAYKNTLTDGREVAEGHLRNTVVIKPGERHLVAVVHAGSIDRRFLPTNSGFDAAAKADLTAVAYIN